MKDGTEEIGELPSGERSQNTVGKIRLSILICHLEDREKQINKLLDVITPQPSAVEIIIKGDSGEMTIGAKRNDLLSRSAGDYVCFIDDDDMVSEFYAEEILKAIESNPDCVGFNGAIVSPEGKRDLVSYRMGLTRTERDGQWIRVGIGHLSPVKREIALSAMFPEVNSAEDVEYAKLIQPKLKTQVVIERFMYFYLQGNK